MNKSVDPAVREYLAAIGRKGGKAITPAKKKSGRRNVKKATQARLSKLKEQ